MRNWKDVEFIEAIKRKHGTYFGTIRNVVSNDKT